MEARHSLPRPADRIRFSAICLLLLAISSCGCVRKSLEVTSEPEGAQLIVNGEAVGVTPVTFSFQHHGVYRLELRKPDYVPVVDGLRVRAKFYEYIGIDIISDMIWPGTIRDERRAHYQLKKIPPMDADRMLAAARKAAAEAEKAIPRLIQLPQDGRKTRDSALIKASRDNGGKSGSRNKKPAPATTKPEAKPVPRKEPVEEADPLDIPEIEESRDK